MNNLIAFPLNITLNDIAQVVLLYLCAYYLIKSIYNTRAWILAKGLMAISIIYGLFWLADFTVMTSILDSLFNVLLIGIIIMFQPQLQQLFERIGSMPFREILKRQNVADSYCKEEDVKEILDACTAMSKAKTGALIVIERKIPLAEYTTTGIKLESFVSTELLLNIFEKNTPLHDGAVIIKNDRVIAATCYLPLTQSKTISKKYGTRHRAAIGISESTDAVVIVVSEETGKMSLCVEGNIQEVNQDKLSKLLTKDSKIFERSSRHTSPLFKLAVMAGSLFLWLFILNANDPIKTITFSNIPVQIQNEQVLSDINKYYSITKGNRVDVKITGRNSQLKNLTRDDIEAFADFKNISITYAVPIELFTDVEGINYEIVGNEILNIEIEDGKQLEQDILMNVSGIGKEGEYLKEIILNDNTVVISGPKSLIDTIDRATIDVDLDVPAAHYIISVFDRNGENITSKVSLSKTLVQAQPVYLPTKTVNLEVMVGEEVILCPILIASADIDKVKDIPIEIIITDESATIYTIDVQKYLPEGVYYAGKEKVEIEIGGTSND